jgi:hypothetical protein
MADRFPLIINPTTKRIEELAAGDNLDLTNNSIVGASTITASTFIGNLSGVADFALGLGDAALIAGGTIDPERLNGYYNIGVGTADNLSNAANIQDGIIERERLSGDYDINITGIAASASVLTDGSNILDGIISADRLSGTYNINITGAAYEAIGAATSVRVEQYSENAEYYLSFFSNYGTELTPGISTFLVYNPAQQRIGLGTDIPEYSIDVAGDIRASNYGRFNNILSSNLNISGVTTSHTLNADLFYSSGISTTGSLSIGSTQVISNSLELQNITSIDEVTRLTLENALEIEPNNFNSLNVSGVSTFVGFGTFGDSVNIGDDLYIGNNLLTSGITTLSANGGITSTGGSLYVNGNGYFSGVVTSSGFYVDGNLIGSATSLSSLYVSGLSTFVGIGTFSDILYVKNNIFTNSFNSNTLDTETGNINTLEGINLSYSGIGTINTLDTETGNINTLEGINLSYSGIGTINTLDTETGTIDYLTNTNLTSGIGTINTLEGINLSYSGIGTIETLDTTNGTIDYLTTTNLTSGIGTINTLDTETGTIDYLTNTNLTSGIGTINTLDTTSGTIDYLTNTNLTSGIGTIETLDTTNGTIDYLTNTNLTSGIGTIETLDTTNGTIDYLTNTNLTSGIGTINTLDVNLAYIGISTIDNLSNTYLNVSGVGTVASLNATSIDIDNLDAANAIISGVITATTFSTGTSGNAINITTNTISGPSEITIDPSTVGDNTGSLRIKGDLYVDGTQTYINSTTIELADFNVGIATTVGSNQLLDGAGIGIGSTGIRKTLTYDYTSDSLESSENFNLILGKSYKIDGNELLSSTQLTIENITSSGVSTIQTLDSEYASIENLNASNISVSGISTFIENAEFQKGIDVSGQTTLTNVDVGIITAGNIYGNGSNIVGIVTQIVSGIGIDLVSTQSSGKGSVEIRSYKPIGKTIFVSQTGSDLNTGLAENNPKRTIKAAAAIAFPGDTIKVFPGVYVEENPIYLTRGVAVEGTELRNCVVTPKYLNRDLFYVNNSCHITDLSFVGGNMTDGAAIVALQPLVGVATDRFFDAARMIRYNLDFIAAETVGYLTSTDYKNPAFVVVDGSGNPIAPVNCSDDIKDVMKSVIHDITRGGNLKCVGAGRSYFDDAGSLLHITGTDTNGYSVKEATIEALNYAAGVARSCINNVSWNGNYQTQYSQVKDLAMQADAATGSNEDIGSCANVVSAIYSCVGVVTTILDQGLSVLGVGINTTFPGNSGIGTDSVIGVTSAVYDNTSGETTILAPTLSVKPGDIVEVRDLLFECTSGGSIGTQRYPSGAYGYQFDVTTVNDNGSFVINTGVSTIPHTYVGGGFVVNRAIGVTTASYDNATGITTITAPGAIVKVGQFVKLHDLQFSCTSGAGTTTLYPTGNLGYEFKVLEVIGTGTTFVVNTGVSTIPHTYEGGGVVFPPYSPGVGPITQGPYIRNCTNFVPGSIGMKVDGFEAEPGDQDDIGVTGTMSVDSYTQYNQGGIGVSITNGAYSQLVSIFTICDDIAIFTGSGGQCDITNSNSSFGRLGLVADGVGDSNTKSIYRHTGVAVTDTPRATNTIAVSGIGSIRPYDGQVCYFGDLYYFVDTIEVTNGGSGYISAPKVTISAPEGLNGITAQASTTIDAFGRVTSVNIVNSGTQYLNPPTITIDPPPVGVQATASATKMQPIYYKVDSSTLPSSGISTVSLLQNLNSTVSAGTTVYFSRVSLQITSSHSFEWVGSGNDINKAKPALGGVVIPENEVVQDNGGIVVYTSTDQAGNFKIGDGVIINQATGQISGRDFTKALFTTMTPFILALAD